MSTTKRTGISLTWKFFFLTAVIIVLLVGITLLFSSRKATALANATVQDGLKETLSAFESYQADRYAKLKMANTVIAQNPYIRSYVTESDSASILDLAQQNQEVVKGDFIIVTDPDGTILARTDKPSASGQSVAEVPLMKQALDGDEATGLWQDGGNLYNAVALPILTGDVIEATLAVGYSINDALATQIKTLTHSDTAFFVNAQKGEGALIATTLPEAKDAVMAAFNANKDKTETFEFSIGPEKYIGVAKQLKNPDGKAMATFMAFRSLDRELFGFKQFQNNILYVAVGVMILAFVISFLGAKRITGPLRQLTDAINEVKEGNYDVPIEVTSGDEVGTLAESFKKLLAELKEKAGLVEYLSKQPTMAGLTTSGAATVVEQRTPGGSKVPQTSQSIASVGIPGTLIGNRYETQSVLGQGGMGVVLKALDRQLDEVVALKMLKGEVFQQDPAALERFKQELKLARKITHRNVVRTYDYSEVDNYYCISMEYVKGITLKQLIKQRGMLPVKIGLQIGKQLASALDAAHEKGVVHRDIKPQNILLESTGDVKIMDFGIARLADMKGLTTTGTVMGTPDYMSPEQAQGLPTDVRTDVYSSGVVLFEVFTGKLPFTADSALAVLNKHIREAPPKPAGFNPQIPAELERILLKSMAKNPDQRYQKVSDLYADLDTLSAQLDATAAKTA